MSRITPGIDLALILDTLLFANTCEGLGEEDERQTYDILLQAALEVALANFARDVLSCVDKDHGGGIHGNEHANSEIDKVQDEPCHLVIECALRDVAIEEARECALQTSKNDCHQGKDDTGHNGAKGSDYEEENVNGGRIAIQSCESNFDIGSLDLSLQDGRFFRPHMPVQVTALFLFAWLHFAVEFLKIDLLIAGIVDHLGCGDTVPCLCGSLFGSKSILVVCLRTALKSVPPSGNALARSDLIRLRRVL